MPSGEILHRYLPRYRSHQIRHNGNGKQDAIGAEGRRTGSSSDFIPDYRSYGVLRRTIGHQRSTSKRDGRTATTPPAHMERSREGTDEECTSPEVAMHDTGPEENPWPMIHLVAHQTGSTRKVLAVVLDSFSLLVLPAFQPLKVSLSVVRFRHPLPHCPHLLLHRTVPNLDLAGKTQHDADSSDAS